MAAIFSVTSYMGGWKHLWLHGESNSKHNHVSATFIRSFRELAQHSFLDAVSSVLLDHLCWEVASFLLWYAHSTRDANRSVGAPGQHFCLFTELYPSGSQMMLTHFRVLALKLLCVHMRLSSSVALGWHRTPSLGWTSFSQSAATSRTVTSAASRISQSTHTHAR